jgi:uncharacterized protein YecE (DUF72 family)
MSNLRIGTSGWHYPSGAGSWNGVFYPPPRRRPKTFDELTYYAAHFNAVEVNSTFYGQPRPEVTRKWADRTPEGFEFAVKLYQKFTHPRMFRERLEKAIPQGHDEAIAALAKPNLADLDEFRRGLDPLAERGRLGPLLAQFPASFKADEASVEYLRQLLRAFAGFTVAVELRHNSWSSRIADTLTLLNGFGAAWVQIDEPKFRFSIRQNFLPNVKSIYYMRLHGRNTAAWWTHDKAEDRYNYLYSRDELRELTETAAAARQLVRKVYLFTNNHYSAKSIANAAMIKQQLGEPIDGDYSQEFADRYPELAPALRITGAGRLV